MLDNDKFLEGWGVKSKTFCIPRHDLTSGSSGFATATQVGLISDFSVSTYSLSVRFSDRTRVGTFCYEQ
jgi:hypothetical protein